MIAPCCRVFLLRDRLRDVSDHQDFVYLPLGICLRCNKAPLRGRPSMVVRQGKKQLMMMMMNDRDKIWCKLIVFQSDDDDPG